MDVCMRGCTSEVVWLDEALLAVGGCKVEVVLLDVGSHGLLGTVLRRPVLLSRVYLPTHILYHI
jgi:hypothetical protein